VIATIDLEDCHQAAGFVHPEDWQRVYQTDPQWTWYAFDGLLLYSQHNSFSF
jgi:hypothetical protein